MTKYWKKENKIDLELATTFEDLAKIALSILDRMPKPIVQVCGPITSGGTGSTNENIKILKKAIKELVSKGANVFDQTVFEESLWRILKTPYAKGKDHLLEAFYLPLFESGLIATLDFLPNWESSYGAVWEHNKAQQLDIQIIYL